MSQLIIEVCQVEEILPHVNSENLEVCRLKGWLTVVRKGQFQVGQKCVYFPPDAVLPPALCNGPEDVPAGRLNIAKYLHLLPKDENGIRQPGGRVVATRLRGHVSYGVIMSIDPAFGDDPNWEVGHDVAEHYGVTKYEPPLQTNDGQADVPHPSFYRYTSIENIGNYPTAIPEGTPVVITEKIHGTNARVGLILEDDNWILACGSHDVRRKEFYRTETRIRLQELIDEQIVSGDVPQIGFQFVRNGKAWEISEEINQIAKTETGEEETIVKYQCLGIKSIADPEPVMVRSMYWEPATEQVKLLLNQVKTDWEAKEPVHSVILYGEIFGEGCQDMKYGLKGRGFRVFDISVNNRYLNYADKIGYLTKFCVPSVPVLHLGPFDMKLVVDLTTGPTTLCEQNQIAEKFKGREGVVITPQTEVDYCPVLNGRRIVKSVSADYLARKGGTEFH